MRAKWREFLQWLEKLRWRFAKAAPPRSKPVRLRQLLKRCDSSPESNFVRPHRAIRARCAGARFPGFRSIAGQRLRAPGAVVRNGPGAGEKPTKPSPAPRRRPKRETSSFARKRAQV